MSGFWTLAQHIYDESPLGRWIVLVLLIIFGLSFMYVAGSKAWKALAARVDIVRQQLENDHGDRPDVKANLREDLDDKHDQNSGKLDAMLTLTVTNSQQLATIASTVANIDTRLSAVEDTQTADAMKALKEKYHERPNP